MNDTQKEIMLIAQEECAEVTQAISKVFRFGIDEVHKDITNRQRLTEEVGDLYCMIELMIEKNIINRTEVLNAANIKENKLRKWSNVFKEVSNVPIQ